MDVGIIYLGFEPGCLVEHGHLIRNSATDGFQHCYPCALHLDVWVMSPRKLSIDDPLVPSVCKTAGFIAKPSLSQSPNNSDDLLEVFVQGKWKLIIVGTYRGYGKIYRSYDVMTFLIAIEQHRDSTSPCGHNNNSRRSSGHWNVFTAFVYRAT